MNEITVDSFNDLQDALFDDAWNETLGRHRSPCAFRGSSNAEYTLETSLMRMGGRYDELERHLIRNFRKYAHKDVVERDSFWNWLTLAQHHGLPTRLLDWTYPPFCALHFATVNLQDAHLDGTVWKIDYHKVSALLPPKLRARLKELSANVFTTDILAEQVHNLEEFDLLSKRDFLMFIEPPSIDDRIVNQFADGDRQTAERHRVNRQSEPVKHDRRHHQREGNRRQRDQRDAQIHQEQKQDDHHQYSAVPQGLLHVLDGAVDERLLRVQRRDLNAFAEGRF
jgi:hypothetical protein